MWNSLLKNTWGLPVILACLGLLGLIGALVFEGAADLIYVGLIGFALLPVLFQIIRTAISKQ